MNMRFDGVVRERFMWLLLGYKKDVVSVVVTEDGVYIINTGKMGAIVDIGLGVVGDISERQYKNALAENEAKITEESLPELAAKRANSFIPRQEIVGVQLTVPKNMEQKRRFSPGIGPRLVIQAAKGKHRLLFRTRTEADVAPLVEALTAQG